MTVDDYEKDLKAALAEGTPSALVACLMKWQAWGLADPDRIRSFLALPDERQLAAIRKMREAIGA